MTLVRGNLKYAAIEHVIDPILKRPELGQRNRQRLAATVRLRMLFNRRRPGQRNQFAVNQQEGVENPSNEEVRYMRIQRPVTGVARHQLMERV
ncbi:hypothetical protein Y026_4139 [Burkholderia pseudomallei TSV28]|nr:hypothetical protein Y026_4139 [Burkholderia pseudomallei TSV28]